MLTELVSDGNALAGGFRDCGPLVELLTSIANLIVVAEESVEGTEACPSVVHISGRSWDRVDLVHT